MARTVENGEMLSLMSSSSVFGVQRARERLTRQADKRCTKTARVVSGFVGRADATSGARCLRKSRFRSNHGGKPATGQGEAGLA